MQLCDEMNYLIPVFPFCLLPGSLLQKPFPREAELNTKTARLEELNSLLNLDHKEPEIVDAEPDEDQRPPERRRPQLER